MLRKAGDLIEDALSEIASYGVEADIESADAQLAIRYLNDMMAMLDADGIALGFTEVSDFGDDITIPAGANMGVINLLAFHLWDHFVQDVPTPTSLVAKTIRSQNTLRNIAIKILASEYPNTLPRGSGNTGGNVYRGDDTFYPDLEETILAETNGSIGLEESTE